MPASRSLLSAPTALRAGLVALGVLGAAALLASTFATIIRIEVGTTSKVPDFDTHLTGWDRHGPALALLALVGLAMAYGALRGARPAALALGAVGLVSLVLVIVTDVPDLHKVGFIGQLYENAAAGPRIGFYLESAGAALMLVAGVLLAIAAPTDPPDRPAPEAVSTARSADRAARARSAE